MSERNIQARAGVTAVGLERGMGAASHPEWRLSESTPGRPFALPSLPVPLTLSSSSPYRKDASGPRRARCQAVESRR